MLGVCIVGFGMSGNVFHAPLVLAMPKLELRCVVTSKEEQEIERLIGKKVPCFKSLSDALKSDVELHIVVVTTPNRTHFPLAMEAMKHNLHVVVIVLFSKRKEEYCFCAFF
jgi:scyllo-inositol 2-dehydrogenase (NADP+)